MEQLVTKECLLEWSAKTLQERSLLVQQKLGLPEGFSIDPSTLWHYYRAHGVKYLNSKYSWNLTHNTEAHYNMQKDFTMQLARYMQQGKEIWYLDQTSTQLWKQQARVWRTSPPNFVIQRAKDRGTSLTIMGAISNRRPGLLWMTLPCTNQIYVKEFIQTKFEPLGVKDHVLVLDMHPAHQAHAFQAYCKSIGLILHMLPPASCELNPIEHVWGVFKNKWSRYCNEHKGRLTLDNYEAEINRIIAAVPVFNTPESVYEPMQRVLTGTRV